MRMRSDAKEPETRSVCVRSSPPAPPCAPPRGQAPRDAHQNQRMEQPPSLIRARKCLGPCAFCLKPDAYSTVSTVCGEDANRPHTSARRWVTLVLRASHLHRHLLLEGVEANAAVHTRVAVRRQHVVGAARVIAHRLRRPGAQEHGACVVQLLEPGLCVGDVDDQVLGRIAVGERNRLLLQWPTDARSEFVGCHVHYGCPAAATTPRRRR